MEYFCINRPWSLFTTTCNRKTKIILTKVTRFGKKKMSVYMTSTGVYLQISANKIKTQCLINYLNFFSFPGACQFKKSWQGRWFQSGVPSYLLINSSYIETKGECYEEEGDKYLVYEK